MFPLFLSGTGKQANWHIFRFQARRGRIPPPPVAEKGGRRPNEAKSARACACRWPLHDNAELWEKAARPDALHPVKICEIGPGKSRLTERCFIPGSQRLPGIDQVMIDGLSPARFRIFSLCPKAFYIPSPAQHAELPKLSPPNIFARSGSRVFNTLVGSGVKPQRNPTLALIITLENNTVKL